VLDAISGHRATCGSCHKSVVLSSFTKGVDGISVVCGLIVLQKQSRKSDSPKVMGKALKFINPVGIFYRVFIARKRVAVLLGVLSSHPIAGIDRQLVKSEQRPFNLRTQPTTRKTFQDTELTTGKQQPQRRTDSCRNQCAESHSISISQTLGDSATEDPFNET